MGTRNLTMVIDKAGETKIAQYGQWDGYPEGQGAIALEFLREVDLEKFNEKISALSFFTKEELDDLNNTDWLNTHPWLSRDLSAQILNAVYRGSYMKSNFPNDDIEVICDVNKVVNQSSFAADSLFCEWAYVIDLSKNTFEVYRGFNKSPIGEDERFFYLVEEMEGDSEYYPVRLAATFDLTNLPTYEEFIGTFAEEEEEV